MNIFVITNFVITSGKLKCSPRNKNGNVHLYSTLFNPVQKHETDFRYHHKIIKVIHIPVQRNDVSTDSERLRGSVNFTSALTEFHF